MKTFRTFGDSSERIVVRVPDGYIVKDVTDPSTPVDVTVNFITSGYADLQPLDGQPTGAGYTLPYVFITIVTQGTVDAFATIYDLDVAITANNVPMIIRSIAPTIPLIGFNVPRVGGTYTAYVTASKPKGQDTIIATFDFKVV